MRKKTFGDVLLEAQMLPYSREGYSFYKEAAEIGLRGRYIESLLYKEAHRDILEAQELMLQESFFLESESASDLVMLLEETEQANDSFLRKLKNRVLTILRTIMTVLQKYHEHSKAKKEKIDSILAKMRALRNFDSIGMSAEEMLEKTLSIWSDTVGKGVNPAEKQEIPGVGSDADLRAYIGLAMSTNYVNLVITPGERYNGIISLEDMKTLITAAKNSRDYDALYRQYESMVDKTHEKSGMKLTMTGAIIDQVQSEVLKWVNSMDPAPNQPAEKKPKEQPKEEKPEEGKTESSIQDLLDDAEFMECAMVILEDAANAQVAPKFMDQLAKAMASHLDLIRCISKFQDQFLSWFDTVLAGKKDSSPSKPTEPAEDKDEEE